MVSVPDDLRCKQIVELVNDWLEGALPFDEHTDFAMHLACCEGCTEYLRQLRELGRVAARLREQDLPRKTCDGLLEAFRDWKKGAN